MGKKIIRILIITALILAVPLIAMWFSSEVNWSLADFIISGALLIITGTTYEVLISRFNTARQRVVIGAVLAVILLIIWVELAVGVFGTPFAGS